MAKSPILYREVNHRLQQLPQKSRERVEGVLLEALGELICLQDPLQPTASKNAAKHFIGRVYSAFVDELGPLVGGYRG